MYSGLKYWQKVREGPATLFGEYVNIYLASVVIIHLLTQCAKSLRKSSLLFDILSLI